MPGLFDKLFMRGNPDPASAGKGLFGNVDFSTLGPMLLSLGAGIASGGAPGGGGWGGGIGRGLAGASSAMQSQQENELRRRLLQSQLAPEVKDITLPGGGKVSARVGPNGQVMPLDTSALGLPDTPQFGIGDIKDRATVEAGIRKEYSSLSGDFIKVRDSFAKIQSAVSDPSPAGDMAVIFNYMRLLDPGSTVREGEYATAQNAGAVPDRVRNIYNMVIGGTKLTPNQRGDFSKQAKGLFGAQERQQKQLETQYRAIAKRLGVDVDNIAPDFALAPSPVFATEPGLAPGAVAPVTGGNFSPAPSSFTAGAGMPNRIGGGQGMIPPQAVQALKTNPALRQQFEAKYGVSADPFLR